jgi:imidazolonepropionase-like amidohydrolase
VELRKRGFIEGVSRAPKAVGLAFTTKPGKSCGFAVALACLIALVPNSIRGQSQTIVIEGGTLIDGGGGAPVKDAVVVIEGNRIKAVGTRGSVAVPTQARVIKADGMTVMPAFIDAHIHSLDFFPPLFLHYGITTVCDTANPTQWVMAQRDALKAGKMKGPRMFVTGEVIDGPDSSVDRRDEYRTHVNTPEEAHTVARNLLRKGVDAIKVYQNLTPELLQPLVEEAHNAGTEALGHSRDAKDAIGVGLKFIEHFTPIAHATISDPAKLKAMDEGRLRIPEADMDPSLYGPLIQLMLKNGVYLNPTLTRIWISIMPKKMEWYKQAATLLQDPAYSFIPAARREVWLRTTNGDDGPRNPADELRMKEGLRKVEEFTRMYAQAGGRIIGGPDSGPSSGPANMAGLALHIEMEALVDAGLTPMQSILSSTRWAAELLHQEKDLGTVAPGKIADVVLIAGDPLADIRVTRSLRTVIMEGEVLDTTLSPNFRNPIPRPVAEYPMDARNPELETLTPEIVRQGDADTEIEVTGVKFSPQSVIRFDTTDLPTKFISESKLTGTLKGSLLKSPGTYAVTVTNPGPSGGVSKALYLIINFRK